MALLFFTDGFSSDDLGPSLATRSYISGLRDSLTSKNGVHIHLGNCAVEVAVNELNVGMEEILFCNIGIFLGQRNWAAAQIWESRWIRHSQQMSGPPFDYQRNKIGELAIRK